MAIILREPLSNIIRSNTFKVVFDEKSVESEFLPECEVSNSISDVKNDIKRKIHNGFCSDVLINQLAIHRINGYEKYSGEFHHYHYQTLVDTIQSHNKGNIVNVRDFKGKLLKGLKHLHHNSNTFLLKNLENYWKYKCKGRDELAYQNELLNNTYYGLLSSMSEDEAKKKALSVLLIELQNESHFRDFKSKTGEWVVFATINDQHYYLCLATHKETKEIGDSVILDRIQPCIKEFAQLRFLKNVF